MTLVTQLTTWSVCEDVSVVYGEGEARVDALCDFDFSVRMGESVALWGRSGSGKTTILHVLGGLVAPTSGRGNFPAASSSGLRSPRPRPAAQAWSSPTSPLASSIGRTR